MTERIDPAVTAKIIQALASYLKRDPASITEEHHLRDDLGLDSVAIIELLFEIEERFKLQIPDQDLPGLSTVGTVAGYVQRRLAESKTESKPESPKPVAAASKSKSAKIDQDQDNLSQVPVYQEGSRGKVCYGQKIEKDILRYIREEESHGPMSKPQLPSPITLAQIHEACWRDDSRRRPDTDLQLDKPR